MGKVGTALTATVASTDSGASSLRISISGVPMGVSFAVSGLILTTTWVSSVLGNYLMLVKVTDSAGSSSQLRVPVTVTAK